MNLKILFKLILTIYIDNGVLNFHAVFNVGTLLQSGFQTYVFHTTHEIYIHSHKFLTFCFSFI